MNMDKLASKGRMGDTEMRKVDGELSHVNVAEADLIDRFGEKGAKIVKKYGSGTINPETGKKEYVWPLIAGLVAIGGGLWAGSNKEKKETGDRTWGGAWDHSFGNKGFMPWGQSARDEEAREDAIRTTTADAMGGLSTQLEDYLGEGGKSGYLSQERDLSMDAALGSYNQQSDQANTNMRNYMMSSANAKGLSGLESSSMDWTQRANLQDMEKSAEYRADTLDTSIDKANLAFTKGTTDVIANIKDKMNNLSMQYADALGEEFGGEQYDELMELLNLYETNTGG